MSDGEAAAWDALAAELDAWAAAGRVATLWWRDDDACVPSAALDRLLEIAAGHAVPLALAVIPARAEAALAERLAAWAADRWSAVAVLQHGWAHANHADAGEKKAELGGHRPAAAVLAELATGRARLAALFGKRLLPVLVPPWNRIDAAVVAGLAGLGFAGLSTFGARPAPRAAPGLIQVNTHLDIVDWRGSGGFVGTATALAALIGPLAARRQGRADEGEPSGVMTHHLVHDAACWRFCERLAGAVARHPAARWLGAATIFNMGPGPGMP